MIIGGPGSIVEIDETVITKRKYERGKMIAEQQWYFGGIERGSGRRFLEAVDLRNAETLLAVLRKYVMPGTTIISDCWRAYGGIEKMPEGYRHFDVNHSENFVDPVTGAHTNTIESTWQKFKSRHKQEYGTARSLLASYVSQFLWRKQFAGVDSLYHLWSQIAELYPCNNL